MFEKSYLMVHLICLSLMTIKVKIVFLMFIRYFQFLFCELPVYQEFIYWGICLFINNTFFKKIKAISLLSFLFVANISPSSSFKLKMQLNCLPAFDFSFFSRSCVSVLLLHSTCHRCSSSGLSLGATPNPTSSNQGSCLSEKEK